MLGSTSRLPNQRGPLPILSHAPIVLQDRKSERVDTPSRSAARLSQRDLRSAVRVLAHRRQQASAHIRHRPLFSPANQPFLAIRIPVRVSMTTIACLRSFVFSCTCAFEEELPTDLYFYCKEKTLFYSTQKMAAQRSRLKPCSPLQFRTRLERLRTGRFGSGGQEAEVVASNRSVLADEQ